VVLGQVSIRNYINPSSLGVDTNGLVMLKGVDKEYHVKGMSIITKPNSLTARSEKQEYEIDYGQLKRNIGKNFSYYPLPFTPLAVCKHGDRLLCSSDDGLWTVSEGKAKRLFIPSQKFPENVLVLKGERGMIGMLTADKNLFVYDTAKQILKFVDEWVDDFVIDDWNCLWYTVEESLKQDPTFINNRLPILNIISVIAGPNVTVLTEPYLLTEEDKSITISYEAFYPPTLDKLASSYSLDGSPWEVVPYANIVQLTNLEPGRHEVRIKLEATKDIVTISKPIKIKVAYNSSNLLWPLLFGGLSLMGFFMWLSHQRMQKTLDRLATERDKIHMQLQIANEQQKVGQLQMNPHFVFNSLNSISGLIALNENKLARAQLNKFSKMMRGVLGNSMKEYIPLEEELSFLNDYLSLEQLIRNDKFSFEVEADVKDACMVPPMILQPFLENAIVHGLSKKEEKGKLLLMLSDKGKHLEVRIEDNGIGRAAAGEYKKEDHESAALDIIEARLKALNRWSDIGLVYEDLLDGSGQAAGTRVTLHLPKQKV